LTDTQSGSQRTTLTDAAGRFEFSNLPASQYELVAELTAFSPVSIAIPLASATAVHHTLTLPIGKLQEHITVTCSAEPSTIVGGFQRVARSIVDGLFPVLDAQIRVGGSVRPPKKIRDWKPVCPSTPAFDAEITLEGIIDVDGVVRLSEGAGSTADSRAASYVEAAIAAVREWRFTPTLLNRQPVEVEIEVHVAFKRS
jgi:hypothetical protein